MNEGDKFTVVDASQEPVPVTVIPAKDAESRWLALFTDRNGEFDTGRVLTVVVILFMCGKAWTATTWDAQSFGTGIAAVLGGFAAYLYGDAQRPPHPGPSMGNPPCQ